MTPVIDLQDEVHDFLFLDMVQRGLKHGVLLDFHIRPAGTEEMEAAWEKFLVGELKDWENPQPRVPHTEYGTRWLHTSNMHKSVRRSYYWGAWMSAEYLKDAGYEDELWKRLAVILAEDVAWGHPYMTAMGLWVCRSKTVRKRLGPKILPFLLSEMCRGDIGKSRDWTDLFGVCTAPGNPIEVAFDEMQPHSLTWVTDAWMGADNEKIQRMAALWMFYPQFLPVEGKKVERKFSKDDREAFIAKTGWSGLVSYIWHWTQTATGWGLGVMAPLAWEQLCHSKTASAGMDLYQIGPDKMGVQYLRLPKTDGMWAAAVDQHTREGKQAISYFIKASDKLREHPLQSLADLHFTNAVREALFYAEVGVLYPRLKYDSANMWFSAYRDVAFELDFGLNADQSRGLINDVRDELPVLFRARKKILGLE